MVVLSIYAYSGGRNGRLVLVLLVPGRWWLSQRQRKCLVKFGKRDPGRNEVKTGRRVDEWSEDVILLS